MSEFKPDALKTKSTSNIQVIEFNIFNIFFKMKCLKHLNKQNLRMNN
jgi:hypothetical protein